MQAAGVEPKQMFLWILLLNGCGVVVTMCRSPLSRSRQQLRRPLRARRMCSLRRGELGCPLWEGGACSWLQQRGWRLRGSVGL
jgi:hypothetical protein